MIVIRRRSDGLFCKKRVGWRKLDDPRNWTSNISKARAYRNAGMARISIMGSPSWHACKCSNHRDCEHYKNAVEKIQATFDTKYEVLKLTISVE